MSGANDMPRLGVAALKPFRSRETAARSICALPQGKFYNNGS
jgi:hypothetical protein